MASTADKKVLSDLAWWNSVRPAGWGMVGFDRRDRALFISPAGREVVADGELLLAIRPCESKGDLQNG